MIMADDGKRQLLYCIEKVKNKFVHFASAAQRGFMYQATHGLFLQIRYNLWITIISTLHVHQPGYCDGI